MKAFILGFILTSITWTWIALGIVGVISVKTAILVPVGIVIGLLIAVWLFGLLWSHRRNRKMSAELHYKNDDFEVELDGNFYRADIDATAEYSYTPGRMYMPNGDPGYPPDEDFEITDVDFVLFDGETEITDPALIERADAYITDWLYDNSDVFPPPEPDWY